MSFGATPLDKSKRVDRDTFLNKPQGAHARRASPPRASYAYGAPTRSPSKSTGDLGAPDRDAHALERFKRIKEREQQLQQQQQPPTSLHPELWSVRDTSVNVASAFISEAMNMHNSTRPSGSRSMPAMTRSTSVEYESQQQAIANRKFLAAQAASNGRMATRSTKPLSHAGSSLQIVPESTAVTGEENGADGSMTTTTTTTTAATNRNKERGKSPFEAAVEVGRRMVQPINILLRQREQEPSDRSIEANGRVQQSKDSSYDYSAEERAYQADKAASSSSLIGGAASKRGGLRRGRISMDHKAYEPTLSDLDDEDEDNVVDVRTSRRSLRRKGKGGSQMGSSLELPVAAYDKRGSRRRNRSSKDNAYAVEEEEEQAESSADEHTEENNTRQSVRPPSVAPSRRDPTPAPAPPAVPQPISDRSLEDAEEGQETALSSGEMTDDPNLQPFSEAEPDTHSVPPFSIGAVLGKIVNRLFKLVTSILGAILYLFAGILGTFFDIIFATPVRWLSRVGSMRRFVSWVIVPLVVSALLWQTVPSSISWLRSSSSPSPIREFVPPSTPPVDISDLSQRLTEIERALVSISRSQADSISVVHRLGEMESRVQRESARAQTLEGQLRSAATQGLEGVRRELDAIRHHVEQTASKQDRQRSEPGEVRMVVDEETKDRLRTLEDRMGGVEGEVKEALELGKNAASHVPEPTSSGVSGWLPKLKQKYYSTHKDLTIKSADGQDVTGLISRLVDMAVGLRTKDDLARADFASYAAGARVIPSYTSETYELRPTTWRGLALGLLTGNGYAIGRPPVTALDPDRHIGQCWAFHGDQGSLGVVLARRAYVDAVTVDHVAREVAFDVRSAPREMEVWGMLEGEENMRAVREWMERRRKEVVEEGSEDLDEARIQEEIALELEGGERPSVLKRDGVDYVKLAGFEYDVEAEENVQTFEVREAIREMGLDFGIVVLVMKSNWGNDFTCLYRFRVHGEMMVENGQEEVSL